MKVSRFGWKPLLCNLTFCFALSILAIAAPLSLAQGNVPAPPTQKPVDARYPLPYPPSLPEAKIVISDRSTDFLKPPANLREGVEIARTPPVVDFMFYPHQDHPGTPWSVWGDGCAVGDKYYSAIGDHHSPRGTALVYEYDASTKKLRLLVDIATFLEAAGALTTGMNYVPSKIHSRLDMGSDGWLYYATHRGSARTTTDEYGYKGDWVLRTQPETGKTEIVVAQPVPKHAIPMGALDPDRLIFYGGTAAGKDAPSQSVNLFAYDIREEKVRLTAEGGPERAAIFSKSSGRVFWDGKMYDPQNNSIVPSTAPNVRAATVETPQGIVYGVSKNSADLWAFDVKTQTLTSLGSAAVAKQEYITSIDVDPTGRYLYYVAGAHGGAAAEGTPVVQFDTQTQKRKVIAFLHPFYFDKYGYTLDGTFSSALDPKGEKLYITWNGMRKGQPRSWESCALTVIHIPAAERP